jgi:dipeptidyl aminopeptidase/acylaminoacyl peptidase
MMTAMIHSSPLVVACAVASFGCAGIALADGDPIVVTDLLRLRTIDAIDVSDDGSKAAFTVRSIAPGDEPNSYRYESHLFTIDLTDRRAVPRQLTFGARLDADPRWSPDGRRLAFVRTPVDGPEDDDSSEAHGQIWVISLDGGEARPLTRLPRGASAPVWSPDGSAIVVASAVSIDEIEGEPPYPSDRPLREWKDARASDDLAPRPDGTLAEVRAWLDDNAKRSNPVVIHRLDFQDEMALRGNPEFSHLFLVDASAAIPSGLEHAKRLAGGFFDNTQAAFLPDGSGIVFVSSRQTAAHPDRELDRELWLAATDGSGERLLLAMEGWAFESPKPSLDGSVIAFTAVQNDEPAFRQTRLGMIPVGATSGSEPLWLTDSFDRSVDRFAWMSARGTILFTAADRGAFPLFTIGTGLLEPAVTVGGEIGVHAFDVGGGAVCWAETSAANPCVLKVTTPRDGTRLLFDANPWIIEKEVSLPTEAWIDRPDGRRIQSWTMPPTRRVEGERYPLAVEMHGGPSAMWGPGEQTMWLEFQVLASWGYGVVYSNPRGSGGYGYEFQKANFQNWGDGPAGDVLAAVDRAVLAPWVDPERLVLTGGSYAGYLTAWIIAHDHRFRAAVAQRGVYDLFTFFGEGNAWRLVPSAMGGYPWEALIRPVLARESPLTHVRQIRTPLLITHASNDLRTGVSQSEMLYRSLKAMERPVEYIRYPNAGHDLSRTGDPLQRMDRMCRIIEFFERYSGNTRSGPGGARDGADAAGVAGEESE